LEIEGKLHAADAKLAEANLMPLFTR
jgi:hypothetical protein